MATAQNVGAVVRVYDERSKSYKYVPRAPTTGEVYHFVRIVGLCYGVRNPAQSPRCHLTSLHCAHTPF
jgi:hypothetical protein